MFTPQYEPTLVDVNCPAFKEYHNYFNTYDSKYCCGFYTSPQHYADSVVLLGHLKNKNLDEFKKRYQSEKLTPESGFRVFEDGVPVNPFCKTVPSNKAFASMSLISLARLYGANACLDFLQSSEALPSKPSIRNKL